MLLIWRGRAVIAVIVGLSPQVHAAGHATADQPVLVATTSIWADIVDRIDCLDHFAVEALIPSGGDAHSFEPSMRDRGTLGDAALIVANGGGLEAQLDDTLDAVADDGTPVLLASDQVDAGDDPHVWFDPALVVDAAPVIGEALVAAGPTKPTIAQCVAELLAEIEELDAELADILSVVPAGSPPAGDEP